MSDKKTQSAGAQDCSKQNWSVETDSLNADFTEANGNFIELGADSFESFEDEICGVNSPENNVPIDELLDRLDSYCEGIQDAIGIGFRQHFNVEPK